MKKGRLQFGLVVLTVGVMTTSSFAADDHRARNTLNKITDWTVTIGKSADERQRIINERIDQRAKSRAEAEQRLEQAESEQQAAQKPQPQGNGGFITMNTGVQEEAPAASIQEAPLPPAEVLSEAKPMAEPVVEMPAEQEPAAPKQDVIEQAAEPVVQEAPAVQAPEAAAVTASAGADLKAAKDEINERYYKHMSDLRFQFRNDKEMMNKRLQEAEAARKEKIAELEQSAK